MKASILIFTQFISKINLFLSSSPGLAIDYFNQRLYWADPELSEIGSVRLDGSDPLVAIRDRHGNTTLRTKQRFTFLAHTSY